MVSLSVVVILYSISSCEQCVAGMSVTFAPPFKAQPYSMVLNSGKTFQTCVRHVKLQNIFSGILLCFYASESEYLEG